MLVLYIYYNIWCALGRRTGIYVDILLRYNCSLTIWTYYKPYGVIYNLVIVYIVGVLTVKGRVFFVLQVSTGTEVDDLQGIGLDIY